jgi:hypothetical protein
MDSNSGFKQSSDYCCNVAVRAPLLTFNNRRKCNILVVSKRVIAKDDDLKRLLMLQDSGIHLSRVTVFSSIEAPAGSHSDIAVLMIGCISDNENKLA